MSSKSSFPPRWWVPAGTRPGMRATLLALLLTLGGRVGAGSKLRGDSCTMAG